ncbi:type II toxin-antitoxin system RelE/ParE family toxin [Roseivirga pacifica]|uniref:type II toxin-antitoxin system RelE/ParE family toxin n=1 Tax=Roseivirga pacifica TaxID=1267423 RepID=UPI002095DDF2|nr:type II toxin-antitoxin system RelE/ParE family toxin [Roseivirga pacifica]
MRLEIRYSLRARQEEIALLEYIVENFGVEKAKEIYDRIEKVLGLIAENPDMFKASIRKKGLRKCVFSRQTSIYYRVNAGFIEVISFRPNKKNPIHFNI